MNENMTTEIDLLELFYIFKKKVWQLIACSLIGAVAFGLVTFFFIKPKYSSTAMMYILSKETTLTSLADIQLGSQLTKDYRVLVTSKSVLQEVMDELKLEEDYKKLKDKIRIDNPADTRILSITVQDTDPKKARDIANKIADSASNYIAQIMEMIPPKIVEKAEIASRKTSPSMTKNVFVGAIFGLFVICSITIIQLLLKETIDTEEDVNKYLGLSVLSVVPKENIDK